MVDRGVAAAGEQAHEGELDHVRVVGLTERREGGRPQVGLQVVDGHERQAAGDREGSRPREPDHEAVHQPGGGRGGHGVDLGRAATGLLEALRGDVADRLGVGPGRDIGHHPAKRRVLGDLGADRAREDHAVLDQGDRGLVAGGLDPEDEH